MNIKPTERILVIGDPHLGPGTGHRDYLRFLLWVKASHKLSTVMCVGDLVDWSSISYHEKEFWAVGPDQEVAAIRKAVRPWAQAFPKMYIAKGNHDNLPMRQLKTHGLPKAFLSHYNELIGAPKGWIWDAQFKWKMACGVKVVMAHSFSSSWSALSDQASTCCLIQGHHHEMGGVVWSSNPNGETWALAAGCGIEPSHPIYNYRKTGRRQLTNPVIGCGVVVNGLATFIPMWQDTRGRWKGH